MHVGPKTVDATIKKPSVFHTIKAWTRQHKNWTLVIIGVILISITCLVAAIIWYRAPQKIAPVLGVPAPQEKFYSPLTGEKVAKKSDETSLVTAIMLENSPAARPQSGLKDAGVVYEAIAEGGITRFLALYQQEKPMLVGPVRSLREYYLDWATPYDAAIAHVGGSAEALKNVRNGQYRDLDQFYNDSSYWRASDRAAPHNVYTSFEKLEALESKKGYDSSHFQSFSRTDGHRRNKPDATHIAINFSSPPYNTTYDYDAACNCYARSEGGAPHTDRETGQLTPSVVVALHVDEQTVMQDGYREQITTTGSGEADIFQNGTVTKATWRKDSQKAPLELVDSEGHPTKLVRGQTWIAAVPVTRGGSIAW